MFDKNGHKIEMIETITVRNLPAEFSGTYEIKGVFNIAFPKQSQQFLENFKAFAETGASVAAVTPPAATSTSPPAETPKA